MLDSIVKPHGGSGSPAPMGACSRRHLDLLAWPSLGLPEVSRDHAYAMIWPWSSG
jgi:hypothetical protein